MGKISLEDVLPHLRVVGGPNERGDYTAWCPFHDDGNGAPPHKADLRVGATGFTCHACSEKGGLRKLAAKLGIELLDRSSAADPTYDYCDENGELLFQVVRSPGKKFWQRRPDGKGGWIKNLKGVSRVPYRLPDLSSRPNDRVYLVEGEKDADRLRAAGLLATTTGSATSWKRRYAPYFANRDVVILPDNDDAGRRYAANAVADLVGSAASVRVVALPGLPPAGDVSDWLDGGHTVAELEELSAQAAPMPPLPRDETAAARDGRDDGDGSSGKETQAATLVRLVLDDGVELFHDQRGEPYARLTLPSGRRSIVKTDGRVLALFLSRVAFHKMGKAVGPEVIATATRILACLARFEGERHPLHVRVARHEGAIWIDLDGSRAVRVVPGAWSVVDDPPILFRSFPHQEPLPEPVRGGQLDRILAFVNLPPDEGQLLFQVHLVMVLVPGIPTPVLVLQGPQGAAKTSLLKFAKKVTDPGKPLVQGPVHDLDEYALLTSKSRFVAFDNLTWLSDALSDAICRTVSGEGIQKRKLYTDEESVTLDCQCVVGLAGINLVATRPDLLDRSLILPVEVITDDKRRDEAQLWEGFNAAAGEIFGGMLDALAKAMAIYPSVHLERLPRMADFAKWGAAVTEALGATADDFVDAYRRNVARQTDAAVAESPICQVVLLFMETKSSWTGSATDLLAGLQEVAEANRINTRARFWPNAPNSLVRRLREAQPALDSRGVRIRFGKSGARKDLTLTKRAENTVPIDPIVPEGPETHEEGDDSRDDMSGDAVPRIVPLKPRRPPRDGWDGWDDISGGMAGT